MSKQVLVNWLGGLRLEGLGLDLGTVEHHTLPKMPSVMAFKSCGGPNDNGELCLKGSSKCKCRGQILKMFMSKGICSQREKI